MGRSVLRLAVVLFTLCFFVIIPKGPLDAEIPPVISPEQSLARLVPDKSHVTFLKVHKAASSTVQNLLFRFGLDRNLSILLPASGNRFSENTAHYYPILPHPQGGKFDIFALHASFNRTTLSQFLHNDSIVIGIVREPLDVMVSSAYYNRDVWHVEYLREVPREDFIKQLIDHPEKYDSAKFSLTKNLMAADFGFPSTLQKENIKEIKAYLSFLASVFHLVMIVEHFDESLVLLRRYAGWTIYDILYLPLNNNPHPSDAKSLDLSTRERFRQRNFLDYALYDFFYDRFMQQVSKEPDDFFEEVKYFQKVQGNVTLFCLVTSKAKSRQHRLFIRKSKWNEEFFLDRSDCDIMRLSELDFIERLRQRRRSQT